MAASESIVVEFTEILRDLLGDDSIELATSTRRENVPNWDSMNYLNFIIAVESKYGVKFPLSQIETFENVGAIVDALRDRMSK